MGPTIHLAPPAELAVDREGEWFAPIAFSPDSAWLCYINDRELIRYSLAEKQNVTVSVRWSGTRSLSFTNDGRMLAETAFVDPLTGEVIDYVQLKTRPDQGTDWTATSPPGNAVAALVHYTKYTTVDQSIGLHALELWSSNDPASSRTLLEDQVCDLRPKFSRDGRLLIWPCASNDSLSVWNTSDGQINTTIPGAGLFTRAYAISADGTTIAYVDGSWNRCRLWSLAEHREIGKIKVTGRISDLEFHPSGAIVVGSNQLALGCGFKYGMLGIIDPLHRRAKWFRICDGMLYAVAVSADGRYVAVTGGKLGRNQIRLWRWEQLAP